MRRSLPPRRAGWQALALMLMLSAIPAAAQAPYGVVPRPSGVRYEVLPSPHFDVIFQQGQEAEARALAGTLEAALPATARLTGYTGRLRMPVVLNAYNDRTNGFVTTYPFKQEIELPAPVGELGALPSPTWLDLVGPHELTHALHADAAGRRPGVGAVARLLGPDAARALLLGLTPAGLAEGVAVVRESLEGGGRLNQSRFAMVFRAAMLSERPWSLAQMLEAPAYTRPFDRHYVGGAHAMRALARGDTIPAFARATALQDVFPWAGPGVALWYGTGRPPRRLGRALRDSARAEAARALAARGPLTRPRRLASAPGAYHRRPRWLGDGTLLVYAGGYARTPGFYRVAAATGRLARAGRHAVTDDFLFTLDDGGQALFARAVPYRVAGGGVHALFALDPATGRARRLSPAVHLYAPTPAPNGGLWALRHEGPFSQWVALRPDGTTADQTRYRRVRFHQVLPAPGGKRVAVLAKVGPYQGLFEAVFEGAAARLVPWLVWPDATVYDAAWTPDGRTLLLSADPGGVADVYAFTPEAGTLRRLTTVPFGAFEPALSPDGQTLAYVDYRHERYDLVLLPYAPEAAPAVPVPASSFLPADLDAVVPALPAAEGTLRPYRALRHLRPRVALPLLAYDSPEGALTAERLAVGLQVLGADPLERWAFEATAYGQDGAAWGRLALQRATAAVQPTLEATRAPAFGLVALPDGAARAGRRDRRSLALGGALPLRLRQNIATTTATLRLRAALEADVWQAGGDRLWRERRLTLQPSAALALGLQRNARDLVPGRGLQLAATATLDAHRAIAAGLVQPAALPRRALRAHADAYLPLARRHNTGVRLRGGLLTQNTAAALDADALLPEGYDAVALSRGTFAAGGLRVVQPLWFVDDGWLLVPLYVEAVYAYGFAEVVRGLGAARLRRPQAEHAALAAAGAGVGAQLRLYSRLSFTLRAGFSYRLSEGDVVLGLW